MWLEVISISSYMLNCYKVFWSCHGTWHEDCISSHPLADFIPDARSYDSKGSSVSSQVQVCINNPIHWRQASWCLLWNWQSPMQQGFWLLWMRWRQANVSSWPWKFLCEIMWVVCSISDDLCHSFPRSRGKVCLVRRHTSRAGGGMVYHSELTHAAIMALQNRCCFLQFYLDMRLFRSRTSAFL